MAEINKDKTNIGNQKPPKENSIAPTPSVKPPVKPVPPSPVKPVSPPPPVKPAPPPSPTAKLKIPGLPTKPSTKPEEVKLPEKGTPELSGGEAVAPKKTLLTPFKKVAKAQQAPIIETGPVEKKSFKKIGKYIVIIIISLVVLGGILYGYMLLRNMSVVEDVVEEPDVQETTESVVIEVPKEDTTSLKALENKFDDIEDELVTLERGATFDREASITTTDF